MQAIDPKPLLAVVRGDVSVVSLTVRVDTPLIAKHTDCELDSACLESRLTNDPIESVRARAGVHASRFPTYMASTWIRHLRSVCLVSSPYLQGPLKGHCEAFTVSE